MNGVVASGVAHGRPSYLADLWPALLFLGYLTFTVVLFAFGPIDYPVANSWRLYGFLTAVHAALALGYLAGLHHARGQSATPRPWVPSVPTLVALSAILNIALLTPATLFMTEGSYDLLSALSDPGPAYLRTLRVAAETTNPFVYAMLFTAPLLFLMVPLTLFFWRRLALVHRVLAVAAIAVAWVSGVLLGRNKGFADLFLLALVFFFAHLARRRTRPGIPRRWWLGLAAVGLIFVLFFTLFNLGAAGRMPNSFERGYVRSIDGYLDYDNLFLRPFPDALKPGVGHLYNYLTQGYYGLSLSMELEFVWSRGLGNSYFLHMVEERLLGSTYAETHSYPARLEKETGYGMYTSWQTIYPWLASDIGFPGTVAFVFLIGAVLAMAWHESLSHGAPFSVAMFATISLMLFYFPANNQALGFPVQFSSTVGVFLLWLVGIERGAGLGTGEER